MKHNPICLEYGVPPSNAEGRALRDFQLVAVRARTSEGFSTERSLDTEVFGSSGQSVRPI